MTVTCHGPGGLSPGLGPRSRPLSRVTVAHWQWPGRRRGSRLTVTVPRLRLGAASRLARAPAGRAGASCDWQRRGGPARRGLRLTGTQADAAIMIITVAVMTQSLARSRAARPTIMSPLRLARAGGRTGCGDSV